MRTSEIHSACTMLRVRRRKWPDILEDVRYMANLVSEALNKRNAD